MAKIILFVILLLANPSIASECLKLGDTQAKDITKSQILLCEDEALDKNNPTYYLILDSVLENLFILDYGQNISLYNTPSLISSLKKKQLEMMKNRIYWLRKASDSGNMTGLYRLGKVLTYKDHRANDLNYKHLDEIYDLESGYNFLLIASKKGHAAAQYYISEYLMDKRLFPSPESNRKVALQWLIMSARSDNHLAAIAFSFRFLSDKSAVSNMLSMAWHLHAMSLVETQGFTDSEIESLTTLYLTERMKHKKEEDYTEAISIGRFILEDIKMGRYDEYGITDYINKVFDEQEKTAEKPSEKPSEWGEWSEDDTKL